MRKNRVIEQNRCYHLVSRLARDVFRLAGAVLEQALPAYRRLRVRGGWTADCEWRDGKVVAFSLRPVAEKPARWKLCRPAEMKTAGGRIQSSNR